MDKKRLMVYLYVYKKDYKCVCYYLRIASGKLTHNDNG